MKEFITKNKWPLLLAAIALLVRMFYLLEISTKPGFSVPATDEQWYWQWGNEILKKSFWGEGTYITAPLYAYFLAMVQLITGGSIFFAKLFQIFLSGATAFFLFKIAERFFGFKAGIIAAAIYSLYGPLIFFESRFVPEILVIFLCVWGIYRLIATGDQRDTKSLLLTGIVFGLACLASLKVILVALVLFVWKVSTLKPENVTKNNRIQQLVILCIGGLIAIAPVTVRNAFVTGQFIFISSGIGLNLYAENNEYADGQSHLIPNVEPEESLNPGKLTAITNMEAEKSAGHKMSESEICGFWFKKSLEFMAGNPSKFIPLVWKKKIFLISGFENSQLADIYAQKSKSKLLNFLVWDSFIYFPFGILLPLALAATIVVLGDFRKILPLYLFIIGFAATLILTSVDSAARLSFVPFLILMASGGIVRLAAFVRKISTAGKIGLALGFIIICFFINQKYYGLGEPHPFFKNYSDGLTLQNLGKFEEAEKAYLRAESAFPFSAALYSNLAEVKVSLAQIDEAEKLLAQAIELKPEYYPSYNVLGKLHKQKGNLDTAVVLFRKAIENYQYTAARPNEIGEFYVNLAESYYGLHFNDSAGAAYGKAMELAPLYPKAFYDAAQFYADFEMYEVSDALFLAAQKVKTPDAHEKFYWGMTLVDRERYPEALGMMRAAVKMDPRHYQAWFVIAALYRRMGEPVDSINYYLDKSLSIVPGFEPALELKKELK